MSNPINYVGSKAHLIDRYNLKTGGLDMQQLRRTAVSDGSVKIGGVDVTISKEAMELSRDMLKKNTRE